MARAVQTTVDEAGTRPPNIVIALDSLHGDSISV